MTRCACEQWSIQKTKYNTYNNWPEVETSWHKQAAEYKSLWLGKCELKKEVLQTQHQEPQKLNQKQTSAQKQTHTYPHTHTLTYRHSRTDDHTTKTKITSKGRQFPRNLEKRGQLWLLEVSLTDRFTIIHKFKTTLFILIFREELYRGLWTCSDSEKFLLLLYWGRDRGQ